MRGAKGARESRGGKKERKSRGKRICACVPSLILDGSLPPFQRSERKRRRGGEGGRKTANKVWTGLRALSKATAAFARLSSSPSLPPSLLLLFSACLFMNLISCMKMKSKHQDGNNAPTSQIYCVLISCFVSGALHDDKETNNSVFILGGG